MIKYSCNLRNIIYYYYGGGGGGGGGGSTTIPVSSCVPNQCQGYNYFSKGSGKKIINLNNLGNITVITRSRK